MISPSVLLLLGWMLVPLCMTVYFSFLRYNLLQPGATPFSDWENYYSTMSFEAEAQGVSTNQAVSRLIERVATI